MKLPKNLNLKKLLLAILFLAVLLTIISVFFYLQPKPKAHSVLTFKQDKIRILQRGDIILGKGNSEGKVALNFNNAVKEPRLSGAYNSDKKYEVEVKSGGNWSFKIPSDLKEQRYVLAIQNIDSKGKITTFKNYNIRIVANRKIYSLKKQFNLK